LTAALRAAGTKSTARAGREGKGVWGKGIPAPPSLFRRRRIFFTIFNFWCSIKVVEREYN